LRRRSASSGAPFRVSYVHHGFPAAPSRSPIGGGGAVKYLWLEKKFPHGFPECDVVYTVSSARHEMAAAVFSEARRQGIPVIWNQDGAYFPHSYGVEAAEKGNRAMGALLRAADYVLYQSEFARQSSNYFLGLRKGPSEILYNAVDTSFYRPMEELRGHGTVLLAAGSHDDAYRLPLVVDTFQQARRHVPGLRLIIAGRIGTLPLTELRQRLEREKLQDLVEIIGLYSPDMTPVLFNRAHIFLHAKYSDVCPSVVLEAMACGLPVVYSETGGTPELVGNGGIGVITAQDWQHPRPPSAEALADAVARVAEARAEFSRLARQRVVEQFDIHPWLARHEAVFSEWIVRATQ
jgi:glycosyltransferase involved in cell wall biosynthesis